MDNAALKDKEWFTPDLSKKDLKALMQRDNYHAALNIGLWFLILAVLGFFAVMIYPSPWSIPVFFVYGIIYSFCNPRWHECSHGTPFKTSWLNDIVFFIAAAMDQRDIVLTRWSHARHHSYTIITGADMEIVVPKPTNLFYMIVDFVNLKSGLQSLWLLLLHSLGILSKQAKELVPENEYKRLFWWARASLAVYVFVIVLAIVTQSWIPVLLFGLPRFYGGFLMYMVILTQHSGLDQDVWDHRLNSRTIYMNPVMGFLYMDMQYHIEHHLYPIVPFHALRKLHEKIKDQEPEPYKGMGAVYKEMMPALIRQIKDPKAVIVRQLPSVSKTD
jgi:Fatty acid desaturase